MSLIMGKMGVLKSDVLKSDGENGCPKMRLAMMGKMGVLKIDRSG